VIGPAKVRPSTHASGRGAMLASVLALLPLAAWAFARWQFKGA
jgi:hypothetical protein